MGKLVQCVLQQGYDTQMVSCIPKKFAILNNIIKVKENGECAEGSCPWCEWRVVYIGQGVDDDNNPHKAIKNHRQKTGDSLPKQGHVK
jgi:hypothetical protein